MSNLQGTAKIDIVRNQLYKRESKNCIEDFGTNDERTQCHAVERRGCMHSRSLRYSGKAHPASHGGSVWQPERDLYRIEPAGKPAGTPSAQEWSQAGRAGRDLRGARRG